MKPALLLAKPCPVDHDPTGWWMSEKLDGVRAYWDGKQFLSRLGNVFRAPEWFTKDLPRAPLDGELWAGRGKFQRTVSIVRRRDAGDDWKEISFLVFDAPGVPGPYEDRLEYLEALQSVRWPGLEVVPVEECSGMARLKEVLAAIESDGGEGLMLRQPGSLYEGKRSSTLLKVKSFFDDEATVLGYLAGEGKHLGRVGALRVVLANGKEFSIGTGLRDAERENPPAIGARVTFRYQELTNDGVPRFPSYVGERIDG